MQIIEDLSIKKLTKESLKFSEIGFSLNLSLEPEVIEISFLTKICENLRPN